MDDYISRGAVFDWFCESADIDGCVDLPKNNGSCKKGCRHCISGKELDEIPTADVVKVVRCKDCVHHINAPQTTDVWCERIDGLLQKDWFCADGERGTDDE